MNRLLPDASLTVFPECLYRESTVFRQEKPFKFTSVLEPFRVRFEIRGMLFPAKETLNNSLAFELFRMRFEMPEQRLRV